MKNITKFLLVSCTAFSSLSYAAPAISFSKPPKSEVVESSLSQTSDQAPLSTNQNNGSLFNSNGKAYAIPSQKSAQNTDTDTVVVKKGLQVQQLNSNVVGDVTGSIIVKTDKNIDQITVGQTETITIGGGFYLLQFSEDVNLLNAVKTLTNQYQVEAAEIEVNTKPYKAM